MKKVIFTWETTNFWPRYFINGLPYRGLISGKLYDRTICKHSSGSVMITEEELFQEG